MNNNNLNDNMKQKKKRSHLTGVAIIRIAAFAFAIVSWYATTSGLSAYVFGPGWQSALISLGIQSILFVFNLKLPFYFNRIGENSPERIRKKYHFGSNKGKERLTYKTTGFQYVIIGFYIMVLLSSSFFSFIYICNYVVYEHQSGYADDNTILTSTYREMLNDTDDYIKEDTKAMQILASKLLGDLKSDYPIETTGNNSESFEELKDKLTDATVTLEVAKEDYKQAKSDVKTSKEIMKSYGESRIGTVYHDRQDEWERKYKKAKKDYDDAVKNRESKQSKYEKAKKDFTKAQSAVTYYNEPQDTVIAEFLQEMLKPSPSTQNLENYINKLNTMIINSKGNGDLIENYGKLVESTQTLIVVVKDYISLVDANKVSDNRSIAYLIEHAMDDTMTPDPKSKSFDSDYIEWRKNWETRLNTLENVIQHLPKFSESEKDDLKEKPIDVELLSNYKSNDKMHIIDELRRNKVSDINVIEKASSLLFGRYRFTAWFSFALALFFDLSSLLAGLFIYGIQKKSPSHQH